MNMDQMVELVEIFGGQATTIIICWFVYKTLIILSQLGAFTFVAMSFVRLLRRLICDLSYYSKIKIAAGPHDSWRSRTFEELIELVELGKKEKDKMTK